MYNVSPWHKKMWRATGLCCKMSTKKLLDHVDSCYMLLGLQSVDSPTNKNLQIFSFRKHPKRAVPALGVTWKWTWQVSNFVRQVLGAIDLHSWPPQGGIGWVVEVIKHLENPDFFRLWNDCIDSVYKSSPSYLMYLWHLFGTFPHLHQWIIGQFCKELFETTWRWSPLQRGPTKLLMRSRWRETRLLEDLTFSRIFGWLSPSGKNWAK